MVHANIFWFYLDSYKINEDVWTKKKKQHKLFY